MMVRSACVVCPSSSCLDVVGARVYLPRVYGCFVFRVWVCGGLCVQFEVRGNVLQMIGRDLDFAQVKILQYTAVHQ